MGLKTIFQEGMKERRRRQSLGKGRKDLQEKESVHAGLLAALGQKAWSSGVNLDGHPDLRTALADTQKNLEEIQAAIEELQKRKLAREERRKQENERLDAARREIEEKKKGVDGRLSEERGALKNLQKEADQASARLARIPKERENLSAKAALAATPETEKAAIPAKLEALARETDELKQSLEGKNGEIQKRNQAATPLEAESRQLRDRIEEIRAEQKKVVGELDQELAALKKELDAGTAKSGEAEKRQRENFRQLGEKLAAAPSVGPGLETELSAVGEAEKGIAGVRSQMESLEQQKSDAGSSAYQKMMTIIVAGVLLAIAAIVAAVVLLSPKKRNPTFLDALSGAGGSGTASVQEALKGLQEGFGGVRSESEKRQGGKIVVAEQGALASALPNLSGWQGSPPVYSKGSFGELETAHLQAGYRDPEGKSVEVKITDAGTASALLAPVKMLFSLNLTVDDESTWQKVSTFDGIPMAERLDKNSQRASFAFVIRDRFLIELETSAPNGLELLRGFVAKMDLGGLK